MVINSKQLSSFKQKIENLTMVFNFIREYFSYIKRLNNNFRYLDYETAENRNDIDHDLYKLNKGEKP